MKRQFIAGAICPRCAELDKIVVVSDAQVSYRECVRCGFQDDRPEDVGKEPVEVSTRVTRASARRIDVPAEPVRMAGGIGEKETSPFKPE